jgi:hypothetical protein
MGLSAPAMCARFNASVPVVLFLHLLVAVGMQRQDATSRMDRANIREAVAISGEACRDGPPLVDL